MNGKPGERPACAGILTAAGDSRLRATLRPSPQRSGGAMSVVGLDLNATRARAVHGTGLGSPGGLDLEDGRRDLPLAVSLEGRSPVVGGRRRQAAPQGPAPRLSRFPPRPRPAARMDRRPSSARRRRRPRPRLPATAPVPRPIRGRLPDAADVPLRRPGSAGLAAGRQGAVAAAGHHGRADRRRPGRLSTAAVDRAWPSSWTWTATP